jgi:hypothetical protein
LLCFMKVTSDVGGSASEYITAVTWTGDAAVAARVIPRVQVPCGECGVGKWGGERREERVMKVADCVSGL